MRILVRILVCGGRDFLDWHRIYRTLDQALAEFSEEGTEIDCIIEGGAPGADTGAAMWAFMRGVRYRTFEANWREFGKAAGPIRNQAMIVDGRPNMIFAFRGGRGTADMVRRGHLWKVMTIQFG